jgi:integrase
VDGLSTAALDKELVCAFFEKALTAAKTLPQSEEQSAKRSANSTFNQARSMFKPHVLEKLRKRLTLPPLQQFLEAYEVEKFQRVTKRGYNAPADDVIKNTIDAWEKLTDRNMFLAMGYELAYGLRKGEMSQAKWGWSVVKEGAPGLDGECKVKASNGRVQVKALDPFWTIMQTRIAKEGWRGEKDDYVLRGPDSEREDETFRRVGALMRELGWETQKTNHSLRAYAGSQVAMRYGIYSASGFLRHSSIKVTEQAYTHFVEMHRIDKPELLASKWAQLVTVAERRAVNE